MTLIINIFSLSFLISVARGLSVLWSLIDFLLFPALDFTDFSYFYYFFCLLWV